ncbi:MAG: hypothetical protein CM15mP39_10090 [Synechococcus sp.]|nr:MAG: hypothetical protein CM15mP39_10090 [Synechococcus sp.]
MSTRRFKGLYLQATGDPCCFSFVTYTPQTREQMLACGDLDESEEYFSPVIFDFLLFASEAALGAPAGNPFPITYDDVSIITSRQRGSGIQHEYLIRLSNHDWNEAKQLAVDQLLNVLTVRDGMGLGLQISAIETASNRRRTAESFSLPPATDIPMIPEPHEPFDINRKDDSIFLLGSMFTVIFLFLL